MIALDLKPFEKRVYLSSPTMHGDELKYMTEAYETNWMSTVGENINVVERQAAELAGVGYAVALASGTSALHLCVKLAGVKPGDRVFCSDLTFAATVNPVSYEGATQIFIDSERDTWNMDPAALERAFDLYPDVRVCIVANLYGTPARLDELRRICDAHNAVLIEDAAESLGAAYKGKPTGCFGTYNAISFNGNKIITGSSGGMLLTDDKAMADLARKWSTQSREPAAWYQHKDLGYNYRMSNVIAGVVRGQLPYLQEHVAQKKAIYMRYQQNLADLPVTMNPYLPDIMEPNFWLSCLLIDRDAMCPQTRTDLEAGYEKQPGRSCPTEILQAIADLNAEGRPIWKPMHMQPIYKDCPFVTTAVTPVWAITPASADPVSEDIFARGLCLPSDNKMTMKQVDKICAAIRRCFEISLFDK